MTRGKRDMLSMALSGVVLVGFYFSIFHPPERAVARSRNEASELSRNVKEAARKIAGFPRLAAKIEQYRQKVASIKDKTGALSTSRDVAEVLVNEAKRLGVDVSMSRNVDSASAADSDAGGRQISFKVRMPCSYRSFAEYVEAVERAGETIAVEQMGLKRQDAAAKTLMGELTVSAILLPQ
jgi:Tfp pilus assembly protein PilO